MSSRKKNGIQAIDLSVPEIEEALAEAQGVMAERTFRVLEHVVRAYLSVLTLLEKKRTSLARLRRVLFGPRSEKTRTVLPRGQDGPRRKTGKKKPGHGRNGAARYVGAKKVCVPHETLKPGDRCPGCGKGKVYEQAEPRILVRVLGQAPLAAIVWALQRLRCNLCGEIFTARPPKEAGPDKYDASAAAMIALLKYGTGFPFHRLGKLQESLGVPLPPATQWKVVSEAARTIGPVHEELIQQAAQGQVVHNDDTGMRILEWMGKRREAHPRQPDEKQRTGIFTSGIVSVTNGRRRRIALFFTGRTHAGENLQAVLALRDCGLSPPIQMCDALSRNVPGELKTILANCNTHARRKFVDVAGNFPGECKRILKTFLRIYRNEAIVKKRKMTNAQRLEFHRRKSGPVMEKLKSWMEEQIREKKVEETSGLGEAIGYMLDHWRPLTLFLRKPGAPLDNNICERALKKAILHRKNALFYKTDNGAKVGDLFMSLIHTCELNGVNSFDYLTHLLQHAAQARARPADWMPWNYRDAARRSRAA